MPDPETSQQAFPRVRIAKNHLVHYNIFPLTICCKHVKWVRRWSSLRLTFVAKTKNQTPVQNILQTAKAIATEMIKARKVDDIFNSLKLKKTFY